MTWYYFSTMKSFEDNQSAMKADKEADHTKKMNQRIYRDENKKVFAFQISQLI